MRKRITYKQAGVDIEAGHKAVKEINQAVKSTFRPEVFRTANGFAGLFNLTLQKYHQPILVSATDGVGTKIKIAQILEKHDTIGQDLVAMVVDDIIVYGAEPLFFLDYIATGKVVPQKIALIVEGIAAACREVGCALLGGETAEHPGVMAEEDYDLAGFAVGVVEKDKLIEGKAIKKGDVALGLASSGLHSNGYSLVRRIFNQKEFTEYSPSLGRMLGEELLEPTRIYAPSLLKLFKAFDTLPSSGIKGLAHVTGGGLVENLPRILPPNVDLIIRKSWFIPPIFLLIQERGQVSEKEMFRTFNMGIGMVLIVSPEKEDEVTALLSSSGEVIFNLGKVVSGKGRVLFE